MIASFLTPGTDLDLLARRRDQKLRLLTKLKTYFDLGTFYWLSKLPRKAPHKVPPIRKYRKGQLKFPLLNVYKKKPLAPSTLPSNAA
jgi:hypothetical protein